MLRKLVEIQYERSEDLRRGTFRVRGDMIEIYPPYDDLAVRIELWGTQIEAIRKIDPAHRRNPLARRRYHAPADLPENALRAARRAA
jgi:excinuclease UvrABC helicase subunit UvrB